VAIASANRLAKSGAGRWQAFDEARARLFEGTQNGAPAPRYAA